MTQRELVLDIAMNLTRIGNWAADGYEARQKRIVFFLHETSDMVNKLKTSPQFRPTEQEFKKAFRKLNASTKPADPFAWAEDMMTWGSILTHRASLASTDEVAAGPVL